jgi:hypothetical protein
MSVMEQDVVEENLRTDFPMKVKVYRAKPELHGTELLLDDITFDSDYDISSLVRRLQWEVMILPDFQLFVNGERLVSKPIENATSFQFDFEGKRVGKSDGIIYLTTRKPALPGIFVYVNGRSIGDPYERACRLTSNQGLVARMIGIVNADGLQDAVMLGSEQFKEGNAGVSELDGALKKFLLQVRQEYDKIQAVSRVRTLQDKLPQIIDEVRANLVGRGFSEMKRAGAIRVAYESEPISPEVPAGIGDDGKTILLNPKSPVFHIDQNSSVREIQGRVLYHALDILALARLGSNKSLRSFFSAKLGLLNQFFGGEEAQPFEEQSALSPIRMYSALDLQKFSANGLSARAIRECVSHGILSSSGGNVSGRDFLDFEKKYAGFFPLSDIIYRKYLGDNSTFYFDRFRGVFQRVGNSLLPFAYNASRTSDPYFFVEGTCVDDVLGLVDKMDLRLGNLDLEEPFVSLRNQCLTVDELVERFSHETSDENGDCEKRYSRRLDLEMIPKILSFAQERELVLRGDIRGGHRNFSFGDFIYASQIARGCDWVRDFCYEQIASRAPGSAKARK